MQKKTVGLILASAGPFLWGSSGTVAQHLFDTTAISPLWLVAVRHVTDWLWCESPFASNGRFSPSKGDAQADFV